MTTENRTLFDHAPSWPLTEEDRLILPKHVLLCQEALSHVLDRGIWGDVIECGVHAGVNLAPLSLKILSHNAENGENRRVWAVDTWEGLPYGEESAGSMSLKAGECFTSYQEFEARMERCGAMDVISPVQGLVEDVLFQDGTLDLRYSFAFLDMDLEDPTRFAVRFLESRMTKGAVLGFHDYGFVRCPGIAKVVGELSPERWRQWGSPAFNTVFFERT